MNTDPLQPSTRRRNKPSVPRPRDNVRAVPQISEEDRDQYGPLPFIMLRGAWLRRFGFDVGVDVRVEAIRGQITLTTLWQDYSSGEKPSESDKPTVRYAEMKER